MALLNASNQVVAAVGQPIDFQTTGSLPEPERWAQTSVTFVHPVDLGGVTPPGESGKGPVLVPLASLSRSEGTRCPFCGSRDTALESAFGPTLCRATHYCRACRNPFEAFKPKTSPDASIGAPLPPA